MKRRDFLKTAVAAPIAALIPWYPGGPLQPEWGQGIAWKCWHTSVVLNKEWRARIEVAAS